MINRDEIIEVGFYNKPHGVNGEISASLDVDVDVLGRFSCLISDIDGIYVPFFMSSVRPKSSFAALLTIDGINNEQEASLLVNKELFVLKREYADICSDEHCDEMPLDYFIGFSMIDDDLGEVGKIVDIDDSTANILFVVQRSDGGLVSIPAADDLVSEVDTDKMVIAMSLPQGLLDN